MRTAPEDKAAEVNKANPWNFAKKWAATLEFAVIQTNYGDCADRRAFVHVTVAGDGAAYILNKKRGWRIVKAGKRQTGIIVSNAVLSLPLEPKGFIINQGYLEKNDCLILGVAKDLAEAERRLFKSADSGDMDGQYIPGGYYMMMKPDIVKAMYWLEMAANQGHRETRAMLPNIQFLQDI